MKNKDFGFFQQHIEKIALGIGAAVLLGVGATQFLLGEPNAIELDNRLVAPSDIEETVGRQADLLKGKLDGGSPIERIDVPQYAQFFAKLYSYPVATDQKLFQIDNTGLALTWLNEVTPDYAVKFLPTPPVATDVLAKSGHGVLAEDGSERFFALQQIIGDSRPADFAYASASATFSFKDLKDRYRAIDIPGEQRIDEGLWRERLAISSVRLLREELDPFTGEWGDRQMIEPLPGQFAITPEFQPQISFEESQALESRIRQNQPEIRRPEFPAIHNGPWTPPDIKDRVYSPEELQQRDELQRTITQIERQLNRLTGNDGRGAANDRRGRNNRRDEPPLMDDFGDPRAAARESRRGNRGNPEDTANDRPDKTTERIMKLEEELLAAKRELNALLGIEEEDELAGPGRQMPGGFGNPDGLDPAFDPGFDPAFDPANFGNTPQRRPGAVAGGPDVSDEVKVWAHDLTAKPGHTYRYKVIVSVMNPLYRFPRLNAKQLAENRNRISLGPSEEDIESVEWSAPLTLDPLHYFFVDSASKDQKRANIEVWKVYDGIWRRSEFIEFPGNEVGGEATIDGVDTGGRPIPMFAGPIMLDVDSISSDRGQAVVRVLFLDPETNRITTRLVNDDKNSDKRSELRLEADLQTKLRENRLSDAR